MEPLEFQDRGGGCSGAMHWTNLWFFMVLRRVKGPSDHFGPLTLLFFPGGTFIGFFSFHPSRGTTWENEHIPKGLPRGPC